MKDEGGRMKEQIDREKTEDVKGRIAAVSSLLILHPSSFILRGATP